MREVLIAVATAAATSIVGFAAAANLGWLDKNISDVQVQRVANQIADNADYRDVVARRVVQLIPKQESLPAPAAPKVANDWPAGNYCILSNNDSCPSQFTRQVGYLKGIAMSDNNRDRISPSSSNPYSPDTKIVCHAAGGDCSKMGTALGEIQISMCCK